MSDFIYSTGPGDAEAFASAIRDIYMEDAPPVRTFAGPWGTLAISESRYRGFQPLETDTHIFAVIGGPVLCFRDNDFLTGDDPQAGTAAVHERWRAGVLQWADDLSGPFVALIIDKQTRRSLLVTDLMSFIPLYRCERDGSALFGTHVDALAVAAGLRGKFDLVSIADFIRFGHVTPPYTAYDGVLQCWPGTVHEVSGAAGTPRIAEDRYWLPIERYPYRSIDEAATELRAGLQDYVDRVTGSMTEVAHFLSAGEDSRVVAGLLPKRLKRRAFTFLDGMNREGRIAKRTAAAYGSEFTAAVRSPTYYLDTLPEATTLVGSGHEYHHAHTLGFRKQCALDEFSAVFGGFSADMLVKGTMSRKIRSIARVRFMPEFFLGGERRTQPAADPLFKKEILAALDERRRRQVELLRTFRPVSCHEWFHLWPLNMRTTFPNLYSNRRLFRTYEPFMAARAIKVIASVPTTWKLNRRLFNRAVRPFLDQSRWMFHADGRLPYFPWWFNLPIQASVIIGREIGRAVGWRRGYQGSWGDWRSTMASGKFEELRQACAPHFPLIKDAFAQQKIDEILGGRSTPRTRKVNLLAALYLCGKYAPRADAAPEHAEGRAALSEAPRGR